MTWPITFLMELALRALNGGQFGEGSDPAASPASRNQSSAPESYPARDQYLQHLLQGETAGWNSMSDELRSRSGDYNQRYGQELRHPAPHSTVPGPQSFGLPPRPSGPRPFDSSLPVRPVGMLSIPNPYLPAQHPPVPTPRFQADQWQSAPFRGPLHPPVRNLPAIPYRQFNPQTPMAPMPDVNTHPDYRNLLKEELGGFDA
jgi:hypothetical protein